MADPQSGIVEHFATFECEGVTCIAIVSMPTRENSSRTGVVIVVGGPQYRVGSHRQFVLLARALAGAGIPVIRFDYRGMGDSGGDPRTFESVDADIRGAISALQRETGVSGIVLWGLCDGASAALMFAVSDPRVAGIVALNPWARSPQTAAATQLRHYYVRRFMTREFWRKLSVGGIGLRRSAHDLVSAVRNALQRRDRTRPIGYLQRMHDGWAAFACPVLWVLSGHDFTAREFEAWVEQDPRRRALLQRPGSEVYRSGAADHTFSDEASRDAVTTKTVEWIARISPAC